MSEPSNGIAKHRCLICKAHEDDCLCFEMAEDYDPTLPAADHETGDHERDLGPEL